MLNLDKTGIDKLLVQLEDKQFFGNRYRLYKEKAEPVLLEKVHFHMYMKCMIIKILINITQQK